MITRAQKVRLAVFFIIGFAVLLTIIVILLGSKITERRDYYRIVYQDTSVAGLQIGGAVLYRGIRIGRIEDILIDRDRVANIIVLISVKRGTPIKVDMIATLVGVGITGLKQIELSGGSDASPFLESGGTIVAGRSFFDSLTESAEVLTEKIERVIDNVIAITNKETQVKLDNILTNVDQIVDNSAKPLIDTMTNLQVVTAELAKTTQTLNEILDNINPNHIGRIISNTDVVMRKAAAVDFREIDSSLVQLSQTLTRANSLLTRIDTLVQRSSPDITATVVELRETIENLNEFSRLISDDPSILIRSRRQE